MPTQRRLQTDLFALTLVAIGMLVSLAVGFKDEPNKPAQAVHSPLALPSPTPTATPGWWDEARFVTPTMPVFCLSALWGGTHRHGLQCQYLPGAQCCARSCQSARLSSHCHRPTGKGVG